MAIIIIVGGIGSGKTLLAVRHMKERQKPCYANFSVKLPDVTRLRWDHLFTLDDKGKPEAINWDFWRQVQLSGIDVYGDEWHNVQNSRRSMSKQSILMNNLNSQLRKILGSDNHNNFYVITQRPEAIDLHLRYLAQWWWLPRKQAFRHHQVPTQVIDTKTGKLVYKMLPAMRIWHEAYRSQNDLELGINKVVYPPFIANDYYRYYDTHCLVDFGGEEFVP